MTVTELRVYLERCERIGLGDEPVELSVYVPNLGCVLAEITDTNEANHDAVVYLRGTAD